MRWVVDPGRLSRAAAPFLVLRRDPAREGKSGCEGCGRRAMAFPCLGSGKEWAVSRHAVAGSFARSDGVAARCGGSGGAVAPSWAKRLAVFGGAGAVQQVAAPAGGESAHGGVTDEKPLPSI